MERSGLGLVQDLPNRYNTSGNWGTTSILPYNYRAVVTRVLLHLDTCSLEGPFLDFGRGESLNGLPVGFAASLSTHLAFEIL